MRGKLRLYLSAYISIAIHAIFLVYYSNSGRDWENMILVCGPPWLYHLAEDEESAIELTFNMGEEPGSGEGDSEVGFEGDGKGQNGFQENPNFDKDKFADGPWQDLVDRLEESSDLRKNFQNNFDNIVREGGVQDSYIFRKRDYEDITVKEVFPTVYNIDKPFLEEIRDAPEDLILHKERNKIIDMYRNNTEDADTLVMDLDVEGEERNKSPLVMPKEERMQYLDRNLPRKKEDQMKDFISRYMNYDPDKGDLPQFVRDLYYENLQRLAYSFSSDPTYFTIDYFQENLNKEDFLKNSLALYSEFKNKKLGAEILFTLENIYEIQGRALGLYFQNLQSYPMMSEESKRELRVEVIRRVLERYKPVLKDKNIRSTEDVNRLYLAKRIDIMDTLIANTPDRYRIADAIFEKGRIYWEYSQYIPPPERQAYQEMAFQEWRRLDPSASTGDFLNQKAHEELRQATAGFRRIGTEGGSGNSGLSGREISSARISSILRDRLTNVLNEKRLREEKILWKKKEESTR